jgi:glycosyltransferase involved in cell wall biosynthesis
MLFRAYSMLRERVPDTPRLVLAGSEGPTESDWALARKLGLAGWIEFRKNPGVEELANLYREATLFVLSSNEEGFGVVVVEAMASGIPVVCTSCGGPESIVKDGETGYLTRVADPERMALRLEQLLRTPGKRREMGAEARRITEERFSLQASVAAYLNVYDQLLA